MTMPLIIDDTLRSLIPPLTSEEYDQLEANLVAEGCRDKLVVWQEEQILLDGHNRHTICEQHGIAYDTALISLPDMAAAQRWILEHQLGRRNLSDLDRVAVALKLKPLLADEARHQQGMRTDLLLNSTEGFERKDTRKEVADMAQVTPDKVYKVEQILDHGTPALQQAVREHQASFDAAATLATLPPEEQDAVVAAGKEAMRDTAKEIRAQRRAERESSEGQDPPVLPLTLEEPGQASEGEAPRLPYQAHGTGDEEWYTPVAILDAARQTLGAIDLDPASCAKAQETVQATAWYDKATDGLLHPWHGTVFLNPPYTEGRVDRFVGKLLEEIEMGHVSAAVLLTNNATCTHWFHRAAHASPALCFPKGRQRFLTAEGIAPGSPFQGQALFYFGPDVARFMEAFRPLGLIVQPLPDASVAPPLLTPPLTQIAGGEAPMAMSPPAVLNETPDTVAASPAAPKKAKRQALILAQRDHFGTAEFHWKELATQTELEYLDQYQALKLLARPTKNRPALVEKLTTDTYKFAAKESTRKNPRG